jgi:hypothetical protein
MSDLERRQVVRTEGGGGGQCSKTPLRVQDYMGYKSINDPLYRVDKLMVRASASLPDPNDVEGYLDAVERYRETADATALLAYTSSWGESNPYVRHSHTRARSSLVVRKSWSDLLTACGAPSLGSELLALGTFLSLSLGMECFNSNGSKEVIEEYLDQTKVQVVESERLLRKILDYLRLPTLPPLQGKLQNNKAV